MDDLKILTIDFLEDIKSTYIEQYHIIFLSGFKDDIANATYDIFNNISIMFVTCILDFRMKQYTGNLSFSDIITQLRPLTDQLDTIIIYDECEETEVNILRFFGVRDKDNTILLILQNKLH